MTSEIWLIIGVSAAVPVILGLGPYVPLLILEWLDTRGGGGKDAMRVAEEFAANYHAGLMQGLRRSSDA